MSKVSAMQAIREARYRDRAAPKPVVVAVPIPVAAVAAPSSSLAAATTPDRESNLAELPAKTPETERREAELPEAEQPEVLCGHRSMNNRNCRRPAGHAEKNHRYS